MFGTGTVITDGLSPRGRGNLGAGGPARGPRRSIPAWAGEPSSQGQKDSPWWVYPRVGGGTGSEDVKPWEYMGLIPAWAGEPWPWR